MSTEAVQSPTAYPKTRDEVSAVSLARHYAGRSLTAYNLITEPNAPGRTGALASQHLDSFAIAALLIRLDMVDDSDDEVAKEIWEAAANPPETVVLLEHWLREMGIDPASLPLPNLKPTGDAAEVDRLRAERDRYAAHLDAVRAMHRPVAELRDDPTDHRCTCGQGWPGCRTAGVVWPQEIAAALRDALNAGWDAQATPEQPAPADDPALTATP